MKDIRIEVQTYDGCVTIWYERSKLKNACDSIHNRVMNQLAGLNLKRVEVSVIWLWLHFFLFLFLVPLQSLFLFWLQSCSRLNSLPILTLTILDSLMVSLLEKMMTKTVIWLWNSSTTFVHSMALVAFMTWKQRMQWSSTPPYSTWQRLAHIGRMVIVSTANMFVTLWSNGSAWWQSEKWHKGGWNAPRSLIHYIRSWEIWCTALFLTFVTAKVWKSIKNRWTDYD